MLRALKSYGFAFITQTFNSRLLHCTLIVPETKNVTPSFAYSFTYTILLDTQLINFPYQNTVLKLLYGNIKNVA